MSSSVPALSIPRIHRRKRAKVLHKRAAIALLGIAIIAGVALSRPMRSTRYIDTGLGWRIFHGSTAVTWDSAGERVALIERGTSNLDIWNTVKPDAVPEAVPLSTQATFEHLSWAPNDSTIALAGSDGLYLYDLYNIADKKLQQISSQIAENPSWSGSSQWIVYANPEEGGALERIGPLSPTNKDPPNTLTPERLEITELDHLGGPLRLYDPIYILDDTRIAFRITRIAEDLGVYTIPAEGGEAQLLISGEVCSSSLHWAEKKRALIFYSSGENPGIYRVKVRKGGRATGRMRALRIGIESTNFDYNPETGRIVALTANTRQHIWRIPIRAEGDSIERVIKGFRYALCPRLSSDGRELFYVSVSSERGVKLRFRELSSGFDDDLLYYYPGIKHENSPAPSPDNRYIVFQALSDSTDNLWLYDRDLREYTQLTFDSAVESDPTWSADGSSIYYGWNPIEEGVPREIRCLSLDHVNGGLEAGSDSTITKGSRLHCPQSSEDGQYLLYEDNSTLYVIGPEGERKELISGICPALSPSRRDVYYFRGNRLYRIRDWPDLFSKAPIEEMVSPLPQNANVGYNGPPLTVGHDAAYAVLSEHDVGEIKILSPDR